MHAWEQQKTPCNLGGIVDAVCAHAGRGENVFEGMLAAKGFTGMHISEDLMHEEYREGAYKILRISKL